jgi:ribonucleoside-diphosphate reductase beta chain
MASEIGDSGARGANGTAEAALKRMAAVDPELAARLVVHSLPAAAATLPPGLSWRLDVEGLGAWRIAAPGNGGPAEVVAAAESGGDEDFSIETDPRGLARLASGAGPLGLLLRRRLRLRGRRRKALQLRRLDPAAGPRQLARLGAPVDADLIYRGLAFGIDPEWTRGHRFSVAYELLGEGGGRWVVEVDDGRVAVRGDGAPAGDGAEANADEPGADATVRLSVATWLKLLRGDITPTWAMMSGLTPVRGAIHPVTVIGRWIDRAEGIDQPELEREQRQRAIQERRLGTWGSSVNGAGGRTIDPAQGGAAAKRDNLLGYEQLYALWEKRNWRAHELDFSADREQWLATPEEGQRQTAWTMSSFYVGEERVAADLAPFVLAAPNGEVETFLTTQLVDEARHAVFFDRFAAEVMALSADDMRSRLQEAESTMIGPWHFVFDDSLRDVANRLLREPDNLELFVEGIVVYHMVTEGVLAMTGQRVILRYSEDHGLYPGFHKGFSLVEQDEHRHIAFGVRFLRDACEARPAMREVILRTLTRLLPEAARVFCPPEVEDASDFVSYDWHSSQIYGFAYNALKRRMDVIGVEIPPPEELMPGPINPNGLDRAIELPVDVAPISV